MSQDVVATLTCSNCGQNAPHELHYVGRLIAFTRCQNCGYTINHEQHDLRAAYLEDLEKRLMSKPRRMLRRISRHPLAYTVGLPKAVLGKPRKLYEEMKPLLRRNGT